jgi:hypothetical protein
VTETNSTAPEAAQAPTPRASTKVGWFERRRQRRRRRIMFEEILGWLLVPFFIYFIYLGYVAIGGLPQPAKDVIKEVTSGVLR